MMNNVIKRTAISGKCRHGAKISMWTKCVIFMMGLWLMCAGVLAPQSAWCLDSAQRKALVASLPQGETFENDGFAYVWMPTLRAEKTGARKDMATTEAVEQKGLFSVYKQSQAAALSIRSDSESAIDVPTYPVVYNLEMKSIGILTGKLWLNLKDMADALSLAETYHLSLSWTNNKMETAFYDIPENVDIQALRKQLQADARVVRVTLNMVDRIHNLR
jgi:hypothetical protein